MTSTLKGKWGFDSNLILYALNKNSSFNSQIGNFFRKTRDLIDFYVTHQNILESHYNLVRKYKISSKRAFKEINILLESFNFKVISPLPSTIYRYYEIVSMIKVKKSVFFDIYLATTYIDNGVNNLLTNNEEDFKGIPQFKVFNPFKD